VETIPLGALVGALVFLIILSAFFSASEISMMALNRYRLKHKVESGHRSAILIDKLLKKPDRLLGIILLGNNAVNVAASSISTLIALQLLGKEAAVTAAGITALLLTIVLLIFAEVTPKTLAATYPEQVAFPASFVLYWLLRVLYPLVWVVNLVSNQILRIFGAKGKAKAKSNALSSEELRVAVLETGRLIPESHQTMLLNILDLEKMTVEDVMIPRPQIAGIDIEGNWDEIVQQLGSSNYTRLPVYKGSLDKIIGTVHIRKVLNLIRMGELSKQRFEEIITEPYFIPEGTTLTTQLLNFRAVKRHHGLVVDEYGDIQGLVTLEEILEEIVGDFTSQATGLNDAYQLIENNTYVVKGNANLRDLNKQLNWNLPIKDSRTLNGLIVEYLEDIPAPGTSLRIDNYLVEILRARGATVQSAKVQELPSENTER